MIQLNCVELLFVIGCVLVCGSKGNLIQYSSRNNKPFFMIQTNDIIGNGSGNDYNHNTDDDHFIFTTKSMPKDSKLLPTLSNGHIGFTLFSDSVYMNALYNGHGGLSHRACIPNFSNIQLTNCGAVEECKYTLNAKYGYFMVEMNVENEFYVTHLIYAHRYYNRAVVNQFFIQRLRSKDDIEVKIHQNISGSNINNETQAAQAKDDLEFTKNETIHFNENDFQLLCGHIMEMERLTQEEPIHQEENACVLWNHVPERLTLSKMASSISYKFVMAVDVHEADVRQEMIDVFSITNDDLLISHINEWKRFWNNFRIEINGNDELLRAIISSTFNIACNLPSERTNLPQQHPFYGLSPTGLGRGDLDDYEGHNFWDTEIFMFPTIALINHFWAKSLLHYRYIMLNSARDYAKLTGYKGARFPWESAATGYETIQPNYEYIAEYQHHITGDISFAMQQYYALTHNVEWAREEGCEMAEEVAKFWESRVSFNKTIGLYEIDHIMGPDEDHCDTKNNVYTNVIAISALRFGSMMRTLCTEMNHETEDKWLKIAKNMKIIYDEVLNYHPEYEGYNKGMEVKQADTILIGYPLQFPMNESTRRNDLNFYVHATRKSGPAMTYSMFAINYLDIGDVTDANEMFDRSYKPYLRKPFNVWSEVVEGENGAANFITGAGGFLQAFFNGFLGIRFHLKYLELKNPQLPARCNQISVKGILYLNSVFDLDVDSIESSFRFSKLMDVLVYKLNYGIELDIYESVLYKIPKNGSVKILLKDVKADLFQNF